MPVLIITRGAEHDELVNIVSGLTAAMQALTHHRRNPNPNPNPNPEPNIVSGLTAAMQALT